MLFAALILIALNSPQGPRPSPDDARYAGEGQRAVEEFLKASDRSVLRQLNATNELGGFLRFEGNGFLCPVWNDFRFASGSATMNLLAKV